MKKTTWKFVPVFLIIVLFIAIKPIRTEYIMRGIAENEFKDLRINDSLKKLLIGPLVKNYGEYLEFKWLNVLEWGDTAALYIDVFKRPNSISWRDNFFWPRTTMDYQWYYFEFPEGTSKFAEILPSQHEKRAIDSSKYKLYHRKDEVSNSINFTVIPERLFYFLQKGYFTVVEKNDDYTIVDFYEPIANIVHKHTGETISTMSAKVFVNDSLQVLIIPYDVPSEIRNKK